MEGIMQQMLPGGARGDSPLEQAQEVMYQAFDTPSESKRMALAKKALRISPDCADAYVLLAEHATTHEEALKLYEQGLAAGERALGKRGFKEYAGQFWGALETRPYMRAREGLARCLWDAGRCDEAVAHYQEMLRLNPNDNQGIRYLLASSLLTLDRDDELAELLQQYEDDASAEWAYAEALLAFRKEGDSARSGRLLKAAKRVNRHVPAYLTGSKPLPRQLPEYISRGQDTEAVSYAAEFLKAWRNTPGAVSWVRKTLRVPLPKPPKARKPSWPQLKLALLRLPQAPGETWQVDARRDETVRDPLGEPLELWRVLVTDHSGDRLLLAEVGEGEPRPGDVWEMLLQTMLRPEDGDPHRPALIEVRREDLLNSWRAKLNQVGVDAVRREALDHLERVARQTAPPPGTLQRLLSREFDAPESDLAEVPQQIGEVWQADARQLGTWIDIGGQPQRPWTVLVINRSDDKVLASEVLEEEPSDEELWQTVHRAMRQPVFGEPHRPGVIEVTAEKYRRALQPHLAAADIRCVACERLDLLDAMFAELSDHVAGSKSMAALVSVPGVTPAQVGSFFEAAADYYRRAPWRHILGDVVIQVDCDSFQHGRWYAVVMGQSGVTQGLAMYEDLEIVKQTICGDDSEEENCRRMSGLSVTFGEAFDIAPADLDAAEQHGWPVAGPEAYPSALRVNPGLAFRPPLAWELELLDGCLRVLPDFVAERSAAATKTATLLSKTLCLKLARLDEK
jgi:tetratricopeptide (TPR) repeat protein